MKKILLFLTIFLTINGVEQRPSNWYNSFNAHYEPGETIIVKNNSNNTIYLFGSIFCKIENDIKFITDGFKLEPQEQMLIELCNIYSKNKITNLTVYNYNKHQQVNIEIVIGSKYVVTEEFSNYIGYLKLSEVSRFYL